MSHQCKDCLYFHKEERMEKLGNTEYKMEICQCWIHGNNWHPTVLSTLPNGYCHRWAYKGNGTPADHTAKIEWHTGEPEHDGRYYAKIWCNDYDPGTGEFYEYADIITLPFTVRYGWNTSKWNGKYILSDSYSPTKWADVAEWAEIEVRGK